MTEKKDEDFSQIFDLLKQIKYLFITEKNKETEYKASRDFLIIVNQLISQWIDLERNLGKEFSYIELLIEEIVDLVISGNNIDSFEDKYQKLLKEIEKVWNRKRIIIYGNTWYSFALFQIIRLSEIQIIGIVLTQDNGYEQKFFSEHGIKVILKSELVNINHDYLIVCDDLENDEVIHTFENKQVNFLKFVFNYYIHSPEFTLNYIENFVELKGNYQGIVTGISYMQLGIYKEKLKYPMALLANPSQDLYYDFKMFEYAYRKSGNQINVKYAIIGLCLYSFEYDMSKSREVSGRSLYYYPIVGTMHNFRYQEEFILEYQTTKNVLKELVLENFEENLRNLIRRNTINANNDSGQMEFDSNKLTKEEYAEIIKEGTTVFSKNYPETVKENIKIFKNYILFLKEYNFKILVIIPPFTKVYQSCINEKTESKALKILSDFKKNYNFELWNLSRSSDFEDKDFRDASHLNFRGAKKITNLINEWCDSKNYF